MTPLWWFLLGVVVGAGCTLFGWCLWAGALVAKAVTDAAREARDDHERVLHRLYARGGRVRVGER